MFFYYLHCIFPFLSALLNWNALYSHIWIAIHVLTVCIYSQHSPLTVLFNITNVVFSGHLFLLRVCCCKQFNSLWRQQNIHRVWQTSTQWWRSVQTHKTKLELNEVLRAGCTHCEHSVLPSIEQVCRRWGCQPFYLCWIKCLNKPDLNQKLHFNRF